MCCGLEPFKLNLLSVKASIAARTTGAYSALHPAIIILTANTPRLKPPHLGGTLHSTKSGSPPEFLQIPKPYLVLAGPLVDHLSNQAQNISQLHRLKSPQLKILRWKKSL